MIHRTKGMWGARSVKLNAMGRPTIPKAIHIHGWFGAYLEYTIATGLTFVSTNFRLYTTADNAQVSGQGSQDFSETNTTVRSPKPRYRHGMTIKTQCPALIPHGPRPSCGVNFPMGKWIPHSPGSECPFQEI